MTKTAKYHKTCDSSDLHEKPKDAKSRNVVNLRKQFTKEWNKRENRREARRVKRKEIKQNVKVCYACRQSGHSVNDCPQVAGDVDQGLGICFICGSAEHNVASCPDKHKEREVKYPYAKCFVCEEMGHLSSQCPDNPRGLYPHGGGCKQCGSVEHFKRDCPDKLTKRRGGKIQVGALLEGNSSADAECETVYESEGGDSSSDNDLATPAAKPSTTSKKQRKIVKF